VTTLVTFPGRAGDLLWALPTVRAISQALGEKVGLQIAGEFASLAPLIAQQPYIEYVWSDSRWSLTPPDEWQAPAGEPLATRHPEQVIHLGYRGWPDQPLAQCIYAQGQRSSDEALPPLDLETPWITVEPMVEVEPLISVGFTEQWFELKYGVLSLTLDGRCLPCFTAGRWTTEAWYSPTTWLEAAQRIAASRLFFGCCSAPHVLAVALGKSCVLVEPCEMRHQEIFYPLGKTGRVRLVMGSDGRPTFDARACAAAIREALK
jgi:hypothetical protein